MKIDNERIPVTDAIKLIIEERYNKFLGIKFNFDNVDDIDNSDIRISFDPNGGSSSYVGTDCDDYYFKGKPTMNLGWFNVATVLHEFGHALGLIHEHQNPTSEIKWNTDYICNYFSGPRNCWDPKTICTNILDTQYPDSVLYTDFDPFSIMLYFFSARLTKDDKGTSQNVRLSGNDVIQLARNYPGGKMTPEEFYKYAYNEDIADSLNVHGLRERVNRNMKYYVAIGMIIIILVLILLL